MYRLYQWVVFELPDCNRSRLFVAKLYAQDCFMMYHHFCLFFVWWFSVNDGIDKCQYCGCAAVLMIFACATVFSISVCAAVFTICVCDAVLAVHVCAHRLCP